ncbi:MAG: hypothetical protein HWE25_14270 [Alphaproteobacteria bacterium]|nr:hypothetical protein [Alphaproteobacteria bacterium]
MRKIYFLYLLGSLAFFYALYGENFHRNVPLGVPIPDRNDLPQDQWTAVRAIDGNVFDRYEYQLEEFTYEPSRSGRANLKTRMHILNTEHEGAVVGVLCIPLNEAREMICETDDTSFTKHGYHAGANLWASADRKVRGYPLLPPSQ